MKNYKIKKIFFFATISIFVIISSLLITAWQIERSIQTPECNNKLKNDIRHKNAACLISIDGKFLFVKQPITNKLALPGGTKKEKEIAPCTAHRETYEETGVNVIVEKELMVFNSFILYQCQALTKINLEYSKFLEISGLKLISAEELRNTDKKQFRFPKDVDRIISIIDNKPY